MGASERVFELLDTPPEMIDAADATDLPPNCGRKVLEEDSFDYADGADTREVSQQINLIAHPGQVIAP